MTNGFGIDKRKHFLDDYKGEFVILNLDNQTINVGRIDKIEDGIVSLLPYYTSSYNDKHNIDILVEEGLPAKIVASHVVRVSPTTREKCENAANSANRQYLINYLEQQKRLSELLPQRKEMPKIGEVYFDGTGI
ncbi:MAG: hypothetical protein AABY22_14990 [Nanoarchaeota archaeon]